jgi:4-amino-4-deoxy-L-arabinose transferase-like glycosyltransferase
MAARGLLVALLLAVFLAQAVFSLRDDAPTFDELIGPSVGYAEAVTGDLSFVHDHPPLYRFFIALPLRFLRPALPLDHPSWQRRQGGMQDRYDFGYEFFYVANGNADRLLFWSRIPVVLFSMALAGLVFLWSKELYGGAAGLAALFLYVFEPNILAHSRLTTNDLFMTCFMFATIYLYWRFLRSRSKVFLALTGISLGLAFLSKFSAIMVPVMLFLLALAQWARDRRRARENTAVAPADAWPSLAGSLGGLALITVIALGVMWAFYGAQWGEYWRGLSDTLVHYRVGHHAFLMGQYSTQGWWYYFPVAFLVKTPLPLLLYLVAACLCLSSRKDGAEYFLLIPLGVIGLGAVSGHINIGIRHVLTAYPFLIVAASSLVGVRFTRPRLFAGFLAGLAVWYAVGTLRVFPSYLAYFNEIVTPRLGYRVLVDSNLDWGQDLKRLKKYLDREGINRVYLSYFGTADPCYYEIRFVYLPGSPYSCGQREADQPADFVAVSATNLQGGYLSYRSAFEWLKGYRPVAQIGYSIFVYDIRKDTAAHNQLGILFLNYEMPAEALQEFVAVARLAPEDSLAHANLGVTYELLSRTAEAEQAYRRALEIDPQNATARSKLERIKAGSSGRRDGAGN